MAEVIDLHIDVLFNAAIGERRVCTSRCMIRLKEQSYFPILNDSREIWAILCWSEDAGDVSHLLHVRYSCFQVIWDYLTEAIVF